MSQYGNNKPPWVRSGGGQQGGMMNSGGNLSQSMLSNNSQLLQYPQAQMFQNQMGFQNQVYSNVAMGGAVSYPTRNQLNSAAFQNSGPSVSSSRGHSGGQGDSQNKSQRVFTGTVTKLQDNFGFVDENVFFQTSCCVKGSNPQIGDRVLVEAIYNATMPFKWNATRIQVLPNMNQDEKSDSMDSGGRFSGNSRFSGSGKMNQISRNKSSFNMPSRKPGMEERKRPIKDNKYVEKKSFGDRSRDRSPDRPQDRSLDRTSDRSRNRSPEQRSASKSPVRDHKRSKSPVRPVKRRRAPPRYAVAIPKFPVISFELDASDIKKRYTNMYVPSDFMLAKSSWIHSFPVEKPFSIDFPCKFHIFSKEVDLIGEKIPAEPSDVDYLFSAKVVLLSSPGLEDLLSKCLDDEYEEPTPLSKTVSVLVGNRGREPLALGGPWSPSVDGPDPETDPGVLVRTAVRNVRALTGIDLSNCTQWYRFLEIYYYRGETVHKGKTVPARVETVVLFIPDVWSCLPTRDEWTSLQESYRAQMNRKLNGEEEPEESAKEEEGGSTNEEDKPTRQPTHHSLIDPKTIQMNELKEELEARNLSPKGLKNQLIARLAKALKTEAEDEEKKKNEEEEAEKKKKDEEDKRKREQEAKHHETKKEDASRNEEKERLNLERKYKMPDTPHIIVHPDRNAKSGRFDCSLMTLSSLLNYRPEDNKEHSYELFLFAEAFNSMLVRDFGSRILHALHEVLVTREAKEAKEAKEKKKEAKEKEKDTSDAKKKDSEEVEEIEDDETSEKDSVKEKEDKKEEKTEEPVVKLVPDRELLLAFQYFDSSRCGYILDKDMEELLFSLGLVLSRAQIKRLVQKVVEKDSVFYKKIAEKPAEPTESKDDELLEFQSNRELMPTFDGEETMAANQNANEQGSGYITFKGKLVDVGKLLEQLTRNETSRATTERMYEDLLRTHNNLRDQYDKSSRTISDLSDDLRKTKSSLNSANNEISTLQTRAGKYMSVIYQVKNCVEPIIRENSSSHTKGNTKWDKKENKKEQAEETKSESKRKTSDEAMEISDNESESKTSSKGSSAKAKKEDKSEKTKVEKQSDETKTTAKASVADSDKAGTEKGEPESKDPPKKTPSETPKKESSDKPIKKEDVDGTPEVKEEKDEEKEEECKEEPEEDNDDKSPTKGSEGETDETINDKEEMDEEEVTGTPRKRRKLSIPTPKKATPSRRAAKRTVH